MRQSYALFEDLSMLCISWNAAWRFDRYALYSPSTLSSLSPYTPYVSIISFNSNPLIIPPRLASPSPRLPLYGVLRTIPPRLTSSSTGKKENERKKGRGWEGVVGGSKGLIILFRGRKRKGKRKRKRKYGVFVLGFVFWEVGNGIGNDGGRDG